MEEAIEHAVSFKILHVEDDGVLGMLDKLTLNESTNVFI